LGLWLWNARPRAARPETAQAVANAPVSAGPALSGTQVAVTHIVPHEATRSSAESHRLPAGPEATLGSAKLRLRLIFSADCWVEIYDASGARAFYDEGVAATARSLMVAPPLRVLLGNYSGVELALDGRSITVPDRARYGATARFRVLESGATLPGWGL